MAKFNSKPARFDFIIFAHICIILFMNHNLLAAGPESKDSISADKPIHITSDQLNINDMNKEAEFKGNVLATQENTVIHSDTLQIFYKKDQPVLENTPNSVQSIQKIIAKGNVKINFDNRLAEADQAIYSADTGILELTGDNCKVTSENNMISGKKIIFHRNDGRIQVESGQDSKRVEAVIHSDGKGLD
ncbi:MAG: lipopolysaccharide transport periplasmic protein LptA [Deltaproteobacteria bacterium]|nr:MAG: lipopolysaccharide transport periplasmic protein LptA [Deltaproteobacteria bacterium]